MTHLAPPAAPLAAPLPHVPAHPAPPLAGSGADGLAGAGASAAPLLEAARRFVAAGQIDAAEQLLGDVLETNPRDLDALSLRGVCLLARGEVEQAFALLGALATAAPQRADIVANLASAHRLAGRAEEARFCLERAVALEPGHGAHRHALAGLHMAAGALAEARAQAEALLALGAAQAAPHVAAQGHGLLARLALLEGAPLAAANALRTALTLRPDDEGDMTVLSDVLARLGHRDEALDLAHQLYLRAPTESGPALLLARRFAEMNRWDEAERHLRRILAILPQHIEASHLLATGLTLKGEGPRALALFGAVVRHAATNPDALLRMAMLVRLNGDLEKALAFTDLAGPDAPGGAGLRENILLALGRLDEAWPPAGVEPAPLAVSVPLGMAAADVVLFARFAAALAPPGGRLDCHAEPDLLPLLAGMTGLAPTSAPAPADAVPLPELPMHCPASRAGGPMAAGVPYLAVEAGRDAAWRDALAGFARPLVGLVWEEAGPGLTLDRLVASLGAQPPGGGTWIALAFGAAREQLAAYPDIIDAGAHFTDARDLAAALAQLDVIVGVDGLALHMAGAMGRDGVALVPAHLPWAWAHRADEHGVSRAIWYPTLRVVRQGVPGDWQPALAAVAAMLAPAPDEPEHEDRARAEGQEGA